MTEELNKISYDVIGCAYKVHSTLGPGLLESAYEACLVYELISLGYSVERQKELPLKYNNVKVDAGYRIDILVDGKVIVELKAVDAINPVYEAQLLTYLKLSGCRLGLLINFNVKDLKSGIFRRVV